MRGFDIHPVPAQIGHGDHPKPGFGGGGVGEIGNILGKGHNGGGQGRIGINERPVTGIAARDLQIDHPLINGVHPHQFAEHICQIIIADRAGHLQFRQAAGKAHHMARHINQHAVQHRCYLINRVSHQKPAVKDRDFGIGFGQVIAVDVDCA